MVDSSAHRPFCVHSIQIGRAAPLGPEGVISGFVKRPVNGPVLIRPLGLEGDEQADLRVHGGPEKAVYAYSLENYGKWRETFPEHEALLVPGGFGENLTVTGCDENEVFVGDIVEIGTATLQVSEPRQPCFKLALRFDDVALPRAMIRNALSGWYYRVLTPGQLGVGDNVRLRERPNNAWSIDRVNRLITQHKAAPHERAEFLRLTAALRQSALTRRGGA